MSLEDKEKFYKWQGLLPKVETEAFDFIQNFPEFDGRNVIVGILDTGVDPSCRGLQKTSIGLPKVIDMIDCTGSGDVKMSEPIQLMNSMNTLNGKLGRQIKINPNWNNPTGIYRIGYKRAFDLYSNALCSRIKENRKKKWIEMTNNLEATLRLELEELLEKNKENDILIEDYKVRLSLLESSFKDYEDMGPIYDCLIFHDGQHWQAVIDSSETGDMSKLEPMTNYGIKQQYAYLTELDSLTYCVNIHDNGDILSICCDVSPHGTHVAGIVAAYFEDQPELNGIAPGAQIISFKIGDTRLGSMETGVGVMRALIEAKNRGCHIINMSFGEATALDNYGDIIALANELVLEHNIIFVSSAGNNGPGLSTVGCPGGTSSSIIGVGAFCTESLLETAYSFGKVSRPSTYTWSSVGPCIDGDLGCDIIAPGGAITSVPTWTLNSKQLMNGTSMSSPNACGCIALLLSSLRSKMGSSSLSTYSAIRIRRAILNKARSESCLPVVSQGHGLIRVMSSHQLLEEYQSDIHRGIHWLDVTIDIHVLSERFARGIYLRQHYETSTINTYQVEILPKFPKNVSSEIKYTFEVRCKLTSHVPWIQCNENLLLLANGKTISVIIDPTNLEVNKIYSEFIYIYDEEHQELGPITRIPITVIKPHVYKKDTTNVNIGDIHLNSHDRFRYFLCPPTGCQFMEIVIKDKRVPRYQQIDDVDKETMDNNKDEIEEKDDDIDSSNVSSYNSTIATMIVHVLQLFKGKPYRDHEKHAVVNLASESSHEILIAIQEGWTTEICLASNWSTIVDISCEVMINFHGIQPIPQEVNIIGGHLLSPMITTYSKLNHHNTITPNAKLETWITNLKPSSIGKVSPLGERDILLDGITRIYQLCLQYEFELIDKYSIIIRCPGLQGQLYESEFHGQLWYIYDNMKQVVHVGDAWPSFKSLNKGKYSIVFQIRHRQALILEKFLELPIQLHKKLSSSISLFPFRTKSEAFIANTDKVLKNINLCRDSILSFYLREPKLDQLPKGVKHGDIFIGKITYMKRDKPEGYPLRYCYLDTKVENSKESNKEKDITNTLMDDIIRDAKIKYLSSLINSLDDNNTTTTNTTTTTFISLYNELFVLYVENINLQKHLLTFITSQRNHLFDKCHTINGIEVYHKLESKQDNINLNLEEVILRHEDYINMLGKVIDTIDKDNIAKGLGVFIDNDDTNAIKMKKDLENKKSLLIDLLSLKALLCNDLYQWMKLQDNEIKSFHWKSQLNETIQELQKWDDLSKDKHWKWQIYKLKSKCHFGQALKRIYTLLQGNQSEKIMIQQLVYEQMDCLQALGWNEMVKYVELKEKLISNTEFQPF